MKFYCFMFTNFKQKKKKKKKLKISVGRNLSILIWVKNPNARISLTFSSTRQACIAIQMEIADLFCILLLSIVNYNLLLN